MEEGTVDVWWAGVTSARSCQESLLAPAEQRRMALLRRSEDRARFLVSNALLRLAVASTVGVSSARVKIDRSCRDCDKPHGKPMVVGYDLHVSVSHSGDWIAVALTIAGAAGVDVEQIDPHLDATELHAVVLSPNEDVDEIDFHTRWTRKEAVLKATGEGLRTPMSELTLTTAGLAGFPRPCFVHDLHPGPGYAAALAVLTAQHVTVSERDGSLILGG